MLDIGTGAASSRILYPNRIEGVEPDFIPLRQWPAAAAIVPRSEAWVGREIEDRRFALMARPALFHLAPPSPLFRRQTRWRAANGEPDLDPACD